MNRIVDAADTVRARTVRNSPDGCRKIVSGIQLGAGPRHAPWRCLLPQPVPPPVARAPAGDTGNSAGGDTGGPDLSSAICGFLANAAIAGPPVDMSDYNIATADIAAGRTAHIPSIGSDAASASGKSLVANMAVDHDDAGTRERQLPRAKSRSEGSASLPGCLVSSAALAFGLTCRYLVLPVPYRLANCAFQMRQAILDLTAVSEATMTEKYVFCGLCGH
jgi:hypothetical protein